jgi:mRNA interferase RelE/StbE
LSVRTFSIHREAFDFLRCLSTELKRFRQVMAKIMAILDTPRQPDSQQLSGHDDLWRSDVGEYRIIYRFDESHVWIDVVGKRNDDEVYRRI